ncbi:hypothetical protein PHYC_02571 [Phycisphaerales bacterium]|nr:hypothetical protein PHYC_02571 [Phycisphaerales bacterium]
MRIRLLILLTAFAASSRAWAQDEEAFPAPDPSPALKALLGQAYLTEDEKHRIRVRHGLWEEADLADAPSRAMAALTRGALDDSVFDDDAVDLEDRAEARLRRGEPAKVLDLLAGRENTRAVRLRAEALVDLGRVSEALKEIDAIASKLTESQDADEVSDAARAMLILARVRGPEGERVVGYQGMLNALGRARDQLDRLSWRVNLAEACLLYEKDKYSDVGQALEKVLTLNPSCAEAWALLGRAAVDGYDFPRAEQIAKRLDELAGGPTPDSTLVRAHARIRQNEGEAAEGVIKPLLEKYPGHRGLRAAWAASAATRFDFAASDSRLGELDELSPQSPAGFLATGRAMASARQYDEAARYLRTAVERAPNWAEPVVELGLSELQAGRDDAARTALERAEQLDKYNVRAANSLTLLRELRTYASAESAHFIVRFKPGDDEILANEMLPTLERIFTRVTGDGPGGIDHKPAHKTVVELYPDHHWFSVRITGLPQLHTIAAATGPVIAMEAPRSGAGHKVGAYDWARVVQHEYTHTVTLSRTRNRLPHWFTEASAVYLEDSPRAYTTVELITAALENDKLFDLDSINAGFVRPRRPTDRPLAYAQGHWMYEYIVDKWGARAPLDLMDRYATGEREAGAFQSVLGVSREQFLAEFKEWARKQVVSWGMAATDDTPNIPTLLSLESEEKVTPALLKKWMEERPDNPFVLELAVEALSERGQITRDDADLCERYAAVRPVDPLPHKLMAAMYLANGDPDKGPAAAIPHLEYLDAREQSTPGYAVELARRYLAMKILDKASAKADRATQISPYDPKIREFAATVALVRKDYAAAERHIRSLMMLEPDVEQHKKRLEALKKLTADAPAK